MLRLATKLFILLVVFVSQTAALYSQKFELGVLAGGSYYYGDLVNEFVPQTIRYSGGGFIRYHLNERFVLKGFGGFCRVMGVDSLSSSPYQKNRNLDFFADVFEGSLQLEFNLLEDRFRGRRILNRAIPYVFAGVGGFYFINKGYDPRYTGNAAITPLYNLRTEGKAYDQYAVCVPLGFGVRYYVTRNLQLGFEFGARYTSTTYLDDVGGSKAVYPSTSVLPYYVSSIMTYKNKNRNYDDGINMGIPVGKARGKIVVNDIYFIYGLTLSYRLGSAGGGFGGGKGRAIRCPRFY